MRILSLGLLSPNLPNDLTRIVYTRHTRIFGRDARLSHPIAALRLRAACYYLSPRLALGHDRRPSLSRKPMCDGYINALTAPGIRVAQRPKKPSFELMWRLERPILVH